MGFIATVPAYHANGTTGKEISIVLEKTRETRGGTWFWEAQTRTHLRTISFGVGETLQPSVPMKVPPVHTMPPPTPPPGDSWPPGFSSPFQEPPISLTNVSNPHATALQVVKVCLRVSKSTVSQTVEERWQYRVYVIISQVGGQYPIMVGVMGFFFVRKYFA